MLRGQDSSREKGRQQPILNSSFPHNASRSTSASTANLSRTPSTVMQMGHNDTGVGSKPGFPIRAFSAAACLLKIAQSGGKPVRKRQQQAEIAAEYRGLNVVLCLLLHTQPSRLIPILVCAAFAARAPIASVLRPMNPTVSRWSRSLKASPKNKLRSSMMN